VLSRLFWERNVIASANGILPTYRFPLFFGGFFPNVRALPSPKFFIRPPKISLSR
jgi:hypothetical protein